MFTYSDAGHDAFLFDVGHYLCLHLMLTMMCVYF